MLKRLLPVPNIIAASLTLMAQFSPSLAASTGTSYRYALLATTQTGSEVLALINPDSPSDPAQLVPITVPAGSSVPGAALISPTGEWIAVFFQDPNREGVAFYN